MSTKRRTSASYKKAPSKYPQLPPPNYFVYILELKETGHFYVGVTTDPIKRQKTHFGCIKTLLLSKKWHEEHQNQNRRKIKKVYVPTIGQKVHYFFATKIQSKVKHIMMPNQTITWYYSFIIKHTCYTLEEAQTLESLYLARSKGNKKCLNVQMVSLYNKKRILYPDLK